MRVLGLELGDFWALHRLEAACCGAFWGLGRARGKGSCSLRELSPMGGGIGWGSGHSKSIEWPRWGSERCPGGQAEMREDLGDHGRMFDGGDDLQGAAALGTLLDDDLEHPFTKALPRFRPPGRRSPFKTAPGGFVSSPAQLRRVGAGVGGASPWSAEGVLALTGALGKPGTGACLAPRGGNDRGARLGVGCEHDMEAVGCNRGRGTSTGVAA